MSTSFSFPRIAIVGLGLIGSSLARAIRARGLATHIAGYDLHAATLSRALADRIIDSAAGDVPDAARDADLVIVATPPAGMPSVALLLADSMQPGAMAMDTGSVKQAAIASFAPLVAKNIAFVPAHPIAGGEKGGGDSREDLFTKRKVILCPHPSCPESLQQKVVDFWEAIGAAPEWMDAGTHDLIYAYLSHLPHLLSYASLTVLHPYVALQAHDEHFRRFLRISSADAGLWADILCANSEHAVNAAQRYLAVMEHMIHEMEGGMPKDAAPPPPPPDTIYTRLFPRMITSALISAATMLEQQLHLKLPPYAGPGFVDFVCPAHQLPEKDIELISGYAAHILPMLRAYVAAVKRLMQPLNQNDAVALREAIATSARSG